MISLPRMFARFSASAVRLGLLGLLLSLAFGSALAQTGTITGQVSDISGAVIPKASIVVTSTTTGFSQTVSTSSAGVYSLPALPPAVYNVVVTASGFQSVTRSGVTLTIAATLPLNFKLAPSGATVSVDVNGSSNVSIETDSAENSTVIESKQITDLPLILRDPYQLVLLTPGVVTSSNNDGGFSIDGQRDRNNNFLLDGGDNNDTSVPGIPAGVSAANPDSVQEFRVIANNFDAEYGRNTGAIIDVITRGGTNQFHGDVYEFGRYNALGARDFFNTKAGGPQDPYVRNDFGASLGGPLWKDRTFFFLNGEVQRFRTTRTSSTTTPTAAFRTGKFTYIDTTGRTPTATAVDLTNPSNPDNLSGLPFDPTIAKIYAITPVGQTNVGDGVTTIYNFASPDNLNDYNLTGRFDHKLTEKHQLEVRYVYGHSAESDPFHDESLPGMGNTTVIATTHNGIIALTSVLSANKTNLFRGGYNQNNAGFFCKHDGFDALLGTDSFGNGRDISIPGFFNGNPFGCFDLGDSNGQARLSSTIFFGDTFTIVKGAHSIKFGGDFRSVKDNNYASFSSRNLQSLNQWDDSGADAYTFDQNSVAYPTFENMIWGAQGALAETTENQFFTRTGVRRSSDFSRYRQHEWDAFVQDTWKASPKLTLIAGVRYAFNGVPYEKDGNLANFYGDASVATPSAGFVFTPVGPGTGHQLYNDSWKLIEPRVGFAFDPHGDGKTAIRGGFGIFHDRIFDNLFGNANSNPPFQANYTDFPFSNDGASTVTNATFPGALTPSAAIFDGAYLTPVVIDQNLKMPTSQSYNLGIQRQITNKITLELAYVGSHTMHALREVDGAPPQPSIIAATIQSGVDPSLLQNTALYTGGTGFDPQVHNTAFYHELFQTSIVSGNYNALQTKLTGQIGGLNLLATYTWAHALDNGSDPIVPGAGGSGLPRNSFNLASEYGNSDGNVKHRGTIAANYDLPIGKGKAFLNHGFLGRVFEGIEISGIEQVQTGLPFDIRGTVDNMHTSLVGRPMLVGKPYPSGRGTIVAGGKIVGPAASAFANAPFGQDVAIHRNLFSGPGFVNTDVVFQKTQTIYERMKVVFRAESYNVLNHPNFVTPGNSGLSTGTVSTGSALFGISTAQVGQADGTTGARQIQGAVKLIF